MKKKFFLVLMICATFLFFGCQPSTQAITLNVNGMNCGRCEASVTEALTSIGVTVIDVSREDNRVEIEFNENDISLDEIEQAIIDSGFEID